MSAETDKPQRSRRSAPKRTPHRRASRDHRPRRRRAKVSPDTFFPTLSRHPRLSQRSAGHFPQRRGRARRRRGGNSRLISLRLTQPRRNQPQMDTAKHRFSVLYGGSARRLFMTSPKPLGTRYVLLLLTAAAYCYSVLSVSICVYLWLNPAFCTSPKLLNNEPFVAVKNDKGIKKHLIFSRSNCRHHIKAARCREQANGGGGTRRSA